MTGKERCRFLQDVWIHLAAVLEIPYEPIRCSYTGECFGFCPRCDIVIFHLRDALESKERQGKRVKLDDIPFHPGFGANVLDWLVLVYQLHRVLQGDLIFKFVQSLSFNEGHEILWCLKQQDITVGQLDDLAEDYFPYFFDKGMIHLFKYIYKKYERGCLLKKFMDDDSDFPLVDSGEIL